MQAVMEKPAVAFLNDADYQPGKILEASWGYEQTNINYFKIVKRNGTFVHLQEIGVKDKIEGQHAMTGTCMPDESKLIGKIVRRKLCTSGNTIAGCKYKDGYGWMDAWSGKPSNWTGYA